MKNSFTEYLIKNGWKEINAMTFQQEESQKAEIFFSSSNQIEVYIDSKLIIEKYLLNLEDLKEVLNEI
ncbi:hypothetical protein [Chryseobacterium balustinum]|jgi:hypothetical protein|uniref:Uncharacterized protein n=1 Tax=Chryseobacterium balustinum TaxID=246 RepID=A0AAX2IGX1_9FLAO|nr:hypothetical protein [Chryseobacterium balustinum]AZB31168.1 hypothetical protein EB354_18950 [Chryseobacterium balustinum]SKB39355.1 hypothetical protein SAMN05421800_101370 [Chryseobacterium balustinum]SQA87895.1 Uncharacterised protein [Chryseobacterium balustinum]